MQYQLSYEAEAIMTLISNFGGITTKHLESLHFESANKDLSAILKFLANRQYININNEPVILPARASRMDVSFTSEMSDSLWVFMDAVKREDGSVYKEDIEQAFRGTSPIQICFLKDNDITVNIVHINEMSFSQITYLQQRYYTVNNIQKGEEKDKRIIHEFISRDKELLKKIDELNLTMPYVKVYLTGNTTDEPDMEYLD